MNKNKLLLKYLIYDFIAAILVWVLFIIFRKAVNDIPVFDIIQVLLPQSYYYTSLFLFPFYCIFIHYLTGFYLQTDKVNRINMISGTLVSSVIISVSVFFILKIRDVTISYQYFYYSLLVLFLFLFVVIYFFRSIIVTEIKMNYRTKKWTINTLIIGTGNNAKKIATELERNEERNSLIGFVSINKKNSTTAPEKILGNINQIESFIKNYDIQEIIVALETDEEFQLFEIINSLFKYNIDIQFTPRLYEILTGSARIKKIGISPLVSVTDITMSDWEASVKRFLDIIISLISLLLLSPFLIYYMIRIKMDSKGPVFYKQERIGRYGKPFNILKFRTMYLNSEKGMPKLSSENDSRVTPIGKILRKYRIDEIPQFWNILKGDMSLVGPRPERKFYIDQIIETAPYYCLVYKIRPGLTSWGPIKIGYSDTIEKMIERLNYDIIYMDNMSLLNDLKILIYTIEIIFKGKGV
ncbi:MAG TPA: sugar transferase [Paludibacter sp.]|nr:sugar transferase [Paludibacter sp.]